MLDSEWRPAPRATVDIYPDRRTALTDREGKFAVGQLEPGAYQVRARFRNQRSPFVDVELRDYGDRETVQLVLEEDPQDPELTILVRGGGDGFCFVETGPTMSRLARIDSGQATVTFQPPLADQGAHRLPGRRTLDPHRLAGPRTGTRPRRRVRPVRVEFLDRSGRRAVHRRGAGHRPRRLETWVHSACGLAAPRLSPSARRSPTCPSASTRCAGGIRSGPCGRNGGARLKSRSMAEGSASGTCESLRSAATR